MSFFTDTVGSYLLFQVLSFLKIQTGRVQYKRAVCLDVEKMGNSLVCN